MYKVTHAKNIFGLLQDDVDKIHKTSNQNKPSSNESKLHEIITKKKARGKMYRLIKLVQSQQKALKDSRMIYEVKQWVDMGKYVVYTFYIGRPGEIK